MPGELMYPPTGPAVAGSNITVDAFLRQPTVVNRVVNNLALNRFVADLIFSRGNADGGAVIYDQITASDLFMTRDAQAIEPGSEFPILDEGITTPRVAAVEKWGGAALITDEARRRDRRDVLNRALTKLRNTVVRKVDTVAMAALNAAPVFTQTASADWTTTGDIIGDLETARSAIDDADMGYVADTIIINPAQRVDVRKNSGLRDALPRESVTGNPVTTRDLNGLLAFDNWIVTNRVPAGTVWVVASKVVGSINDELALYTRVVPQEDRERTLVMAARPTVPIITDPHAAVKITGA
jgi:hypothetical protein